MEQLTFLNLSTPGITPRPSVRELPVTEQPLNRLREVGPGAVSLIELLACVLQGKDALQQAEMLVVRFPKLDQLAQASEAELLEVDGIGKAQAARLKAALELGQRFISTRYEDRYQIRAPQDAANILIPFIGRQEQEHFVVLYLDTRNRVLDREVLYKGTLNTSIVRIAEVFRGAIRRNCAAIIVAHNHPSGDPSPSPEDVSLTRRLVETGKSVEVDVLDHVVVGHNHFVSLRERGLGFEGA